MKNNEGACAPAHEVSRLLDTVSKYQNELKAYADLLEALSRAEQYDGGGRWQALDWISRKISDAVFDIGNGLVALGREEAAAS